MADDSFETQYKDFLKAIAEKKDNVNKLTGDFVYKNFVTFTFGIPMGMNNKATQVVQNINKELADKLHGDTALSDDDKKLIKGANKFINSKPECLINPNQGTMLHMTVGPTAREKENIKNIQTNVEIMIKLGVNLDLKDIEKRTPAQLAAIPIKKNESTTDLLELDQKKQLAIDSLNKINKLGEISAAQTTPTVTQHTPKTNRVNSDEASVSSKKSSKKTSSKKESANNSNGSPSSNIKINNSATIEASEKNLFVTLLVNIQNTISNAFSVFLPQNTSEDTAIIIDQHNSPNSSKKSPANQYDNSNNTNKLTDNIGNLPTPPHNKNLMKNKKINNSRL